MIYLIGHGPSPRECEGIGGMVITLILQVYDYIEMLGELNFTVM